MSATYKIVFTGKLKQDTNQSEVISQLSALLNIPKTVCEKLFDGKAYALLKDLTSIEAVKKESNFKALGLITKVQPQKVNLQPTTEQNQFITSAVTEQPKNTAEAPHIDCSTLVVQPRKTPHRQRFAYIIKNWRVKVMTLLLYSCYLLLLLSSVLAINTAIKLFTFNAKEQVEQPALSYQSYLRYIESQVSRPKSAYTNNNNASYQALQDQQQVNQYFMDFSAAINHYANALGQLNVNEMGGGKLKQHLQEIDALGPKFAFWQQLTQLAQQLEINAATMASLSDANPKKIQWINAIDWISQRYIRQQQEKNEQPTISTSLNTQTHHQLNLITLLCFMCFMCLAATSLKSKLKPSSH